MASNFEFYSPTRVIFGKGTEQRVGALVREYGGTRVLIVYGGKSAVRSGVLDRAENSLAEAGISSWTLGGVVPNPHLDKVYEGIRIGKENSIDFLLAVGGGSVMDIAKLASITADGSCTVRDQLKNPRIGKKTVKTIMIPTTAGTGSEATPNSIVAVPEEQLKVGIVNPEMIADAVILDGEMIRRLPRKIAASTGIDALCHAIECYTSAKANPFQ